jgi:uncharacterized protein
MLSYFGDGTKVIELRGRMDLRTLYWILSILLIAVGTLGAFLPILPGAPLALAGYILAAWIDRFERVGWKALLLLGTITVISLMVDFAASALGAKRVGASKYAIIGAVLGSLVGMFFLLPGLLLGPFVGAVLGEYYACRDMDQATRAGIGTWLGMLVGAAIKSALAFSMLGVFLLAFLV